MAAPVAEGAAASAAVALRAVLARAGRAEERSGAQRKQRGLWRWGRPSPSRCCGSSTTPDIAASARITCRRLSPRLPRFEFYIVLQFCRSHPNIPSVLYVCSNEMTASAVLQLPEDIRWHFIGHLQSNKVKPLLGIHICFHSLNYSLAHYAFYKSREEPLSARFIRLQVTN